MILKPYTSTIKTTAMEKFRGGIPALYADYVMKALCFIPLLFLWRGLFASGGDVGMSLAQILSYTYISNLLSEQLSVSTPMSDWMGGEGFAIVCKRPTNTLGDYAAQTVGRWIPALLLYSLPMVFISPLLGVSLLPRSPWFVPSLLLCISLGFAVEFIFACFVLRLRNTSWLATSIRMSLNYLFSGGLIPFALLPWGLGDVLRLLPFGSLAGAPLSVFAGLEPPGRILLTQLFWNIVIWPLTLLYFRKSRERMVSYGG